MTKYANIEPKSLSVRKVSSMKEFVSFIKPEVNNKEVLRVPSQYHPSPIITDTANIQALMSTPIKVTLTLAEILKIKPKYGIT